MAARKKTRAKRSKADGEFVSEAEEILERLRSDLVDLYEQREEGDVDPDLVNRMFRSAHSLKGLAGMFGFAGVGELAHSLEDMLDGLRMGRVPLVGPAVEVVEEVLAVFGALIGADPDEDRNALDALVASMTARLSEAVAEASEAPSDAAAIDLDPSILRALTEYEEHRLNENLERGRTIALLSVSFDIMAFEEGLSEITGALRDVGEVLSTLPSPGDSADSEICFSLLIATSLDLPALLEQVDFDGVKAELVAPSQAIGTVPAQPAAAPGDVVSEATPAEDSAAPSAATESAAAVAPELESLKSISETVRVDIQKLDELMTLVGELGIQRGAITRIASTLTADPATRRLGVELAKTNKQLERRIKELQTGVLDVRMVPLRRIFEKLSRVVRRLQRDLGKDVEIEFKGADTELDKLIVEELVDPLMHVVRNALDHAIEASAERTKLGKPAVGKIRIEASQRGNHVVIEVADDGRGVDPERVRQRAVETGLVAADELLSEKECLDLLFEPGLSTRDEVTETSGRGVGMDVVRSNMTALGGIVDFRSQQGVGSQVTLTLPITLAIIQALMVATGDQRYAIPLASVLETLEVGEDTIQRSGGRELLNLRGEALVLRRLSAEFGIPHEVRDTCYAVVLGIGDARLGLLVDGLDGQRDAVIKPIRGPIQEIRGIAGATELGDGTAVLVLDVASIVEDSARSRREAA